MFSPDKPMITLTDRAAKHIQMLMEQGSSDVIGIRVGIKTAGCSGMKYNVEIFNWANQFNHYDLTKNM